MGQRVFIWIKVVEFAEILKHLKFPAELLKVPTGRFRDPDNFAKRIEGGVFLPGYALPDDVSAYDIQLYIDDALDFVDTALSEGEVLREGQAEDLMQALCKATLGQRAPVARGLRAAKWSDMTQVSDKMLAEKEQQDREQRNSAGNVGGSSTGGGAPGAAPVVEVRRGGRLAGLIEATASTGGGSAVATPQRPGGLRSAVKAAASPTPAAVRLPSGAQGRRRGTEAGLVASVSAVPCAGAAPVPSPVSAGPVCTDQGLDSWGRKRKFDDCTVEDVLSSTKEVGRELKGVFIGNCNFHWFVFVSHGSDYVVIWCVY